MEMPGDADDWRLIGVNYEHVWNFPHCVGAMDGKHVLIRAPDNSGTQFFNYKGTFSVVLLAVIDAAYRFIYIDVGSYGRNSDGGIFKRSSIRRALDDGRLNLPPPETITGSEEMGPFPYVFVADAAFPLKENLLRPHPVGRRQCTREQLIFNYRLSRARRIIENGFGLLWVRWGIYRRTLELRAQNAVSIVKATCVLNNFIQRTSTPAAILALPQDQEVRQPDGVQNLGRMGNRAADGAIAVHEKFARYFATTGAVAWQEAYVRRGVEE